MEAASTIWTLKPFDRLTAGEVYDILRLRSAVFVVEQDCLYLDPDNTDQKAFHLMGFQGKALVAYSRLFAPGDHYQEAAIGRIVTAPEIRGKGMGKALMLKSLEIMKRRYAPCTLRIGAQCYLERFYTALGFQASGEPYLEDGIPHMEMVITLAQ